MFDLPYFDFDWATALFLIAVALVIFMIWRMHTRLDNDYDLLDLLMEGDPRKASLNKHILVCFALLSVWLVVMRTLDFAQAISSNVDGLLLGVLGIFVLGRVGNQAVDRFARRPPSDTMIDNAQNVTIEPRPTAKSKNETS